MRTSTFLAALLIAFPLHAGLRQQIEAKSGWVGYSVPINGHHRVCSYPDLQSIDHSNATSSALYVLYEVNAGRIESVRLSSPECESQPQVQWLQSVDPAESARLLRSIIDGGERSLAKKAVNALALHQGTTDALIDIARHHPTPKIRSVALFWVSQAAGERAAAVLKDAVENDPEQEVKTKAVFGIAQLPDDQSIPMLVDLMKNNRNRAVRKKAAFWLGQKDDPRALKALAAILEQ